MWTRLRAYVSGLLRRNTIDSEVNEELRFHVEMETQANVERGMMPYEARRAALRDFGGVVQTKESIRDVRGLWLDSLTQDVRYALRRLRKDSAFSTAAILTIAMAIGLNTAIFSVANGVWLRPIAMRDSGALVAIERPYFPNVPMTTWATVPDFLDWRDRARSFEDLTMATTPERVVIDTQVGKRTEQISFVSVNFFAVLGASPLIGRTFGGNELAQPAGRVAVLSEDLWRRLFDADPSVVGRRLTLSWRDTASLDYEIVGVMPRSFQLEYESEATSGNGIFVPYTDWPADRSNRMFGGLFNRVYGRLKPGVSVDQANTEMVALSAALKREHPKDRRPPAVKVSSLHTQLLGNTRPVMLMLALAVAVVLLIGCSNVASLQIARSARRAHEMAIRASLGSGAWRLMQQQLVESLVLGVVGGSLALVLAPWAMRILLLAAPPTLARVSEVSIDGRVLTFTALISFLTGIAVGLVPAWRAVKPGLWEGLKDRRRVGMSRRSPFKGAIVLVDVALVVLLLVAAGLMTRSLWRMASLDTGFGSKNILIAELAVPKEVGGDRGRWEATERNLLAAVRAVPGVANATITDFYPFFPYPRALRTVQFADGREMQVLVCAVDSNIAATMALPIVAGRFIRPAEEDRQSVVVSADVGRGLQGQTVGQRLKIGEMWFDVVGVAGDITEMGSSTDLGPADRFVFGATWNGLQRSSLPTIYVARQPTNATTLIVRTHAAPATVARSLPKILRTADGNLSLGRLTTMEERISRTVANNRFYAIMLDAFSLVALLLAAVGINGIVAQGVGQRRGEIAVRMALGARRAQVIALVMRRTLVQVVIGLVLGGGVAYVGARVVRQFLFDIAPTDPTTFVTASALLLVAAAVAVFVPAQRASTVEPIRVLRAE